MFIFVMLLEAIPASLRQTKCIDWIITCTTLISSFSPTYSAAQLSRVLFLGILSRTHWCAVNISAIPRSTIVRHQGASSIAHNFTTPAPPTNTIMRVVNHLLSQKHVKIFLCFLFFRRVLITKPRIDNAHPKDSQVCSLIPIVRIQLLFQR